MSELRLASDIRPWPEADARRAEALLAEARKGFEHKIIAIDDDPTGVQTMHGVHVYTAWDQASLDDGFERPQQLFFVLSNSRGMDAARSRQAHQEMARRILRSAGRYHKPVVIISRSDSTLRGHYRWRPRPSGRRSRPAAGRALTARSSAPFSWKEAGSPSATSTMSGKGNGSGPPPRPSSHGIRPSATAIPTWGNGARRRRPAASGPRTCAISPWTT